MLYLFFENRAIKKCQSLSLIVNLMVLLDGKSPEYPTEPLDKIPALEAEFELAGKKNVGLLVGWEI